MFKQSGEVYTNCGEIYTPCGEIYTTLWGNLYPLWGNFYPLWQVVGKFIPLVGKFIPPYGRSSRQVGVDKGLWQVLGARGGFWRGCSFREMNGVLGVIVRKSIPFCRENCIL